MYTNFSRDQIVHSGNPENTKYTEYLKTLARREGGFLDDGGGGGVDHGYVKDRRSHPLLPISDNEVKFSNIFSARESNALKLHLLQKTSSLPLLDRDNNNNNNSSSLVGDSSLDTNQLVSRRRSTASGVVHGSYPSNLASRKGDSVANILYSTLRHGHEYDNPSADETLHTGSDSKVDYDPHEPLPPVDQIALRHELLNNIRAISRATYFEDLYTGKVRRNSASPEEEILRLLENPQEHSSEETTTEEKIIPSKDINLSRVDRWVKETSEASSRAQTNETTDEDAKEVSSKQDQSSSLYHQSVWQEQEKRSKKEPVRTKTKSRKPITTNEVTTDGSFTESDVETASTYIPLPPTNPYKSTKFLNTTKDSSSSSTDNKGPPKPFKRNADSIVGRSMGSFMPPPSGIIESTSQYLQSKYLSPSLHSGGKESDVHGKRRPFSFGYNGSDDGPPLSISLPNVAQKSYLSTPVTSLHGHSTFSNHSVSRPENINHFSTNAPSKPTLGKVKKKENVNNNNTEQARRLAPHHRQSYPPPGTESRRVVDLQQNRGGGGVTKRTSKPDRNKVPGIYSRLNMNQWVMKKVCFYVNGDEHYPKFDYRFRPGKDIRDLDQLLDILTKKFPILPTGARYIFTMDGFPINSIDELIHENSYVVSSTRKFKALKYGGDISEVENYGVIPDTKRSKRNGRINNNPKPQQQRLSRKLSASDGNLNRKNRGFGGGPGGFNSMQNNSLKQGSMTMPSKSVSDVPKLVAHVIQEASGSGSSSDSPLARQPIRVINGSKPSLQSQVLLNTKTSQPFEDLVRDLGMSVRIPKQPIGNRLETLTGRAIRSYSQLRSELKAGQRTFYIYSDEQSTPNSLPVNYKQVNKVANNKPRDKNGQPIAKAVLGKVNSNSSSELSFNSDREERRNPRRRSHTPTQSPRAVSRLNHHYYSPSPNYGLKEWK